MSFIRYRDPKFELRETEVLVVRIGDTELMFLLVSCLVLKERHEFLSFLVFRSSIVLKSVYESSKV